MTHRERCEQIAEELIMKACGGHGCDLRHKEVADAIQAEAVRFAEVALRQWCPKNNNGSGVILSHVEDAIAEAIKAAEGEE